MKKYFILTLLALLPAVVSAQYDLANFYGLGNGISASYMAPSQLRLGWGKHVQLGVINLYGYASMPNVKQKELFDFFSIPQGDTLRVGDPRKDAFLNSLDDKIRLGVGMRINMFPVAVQWGDQYKHTISASFMPRVGFSMGFTQEFADFALKGNKQYAGKTINLVDGMNLQAMYANELAVGYAVDLPVDNWFGLDPETQKVRVGLRLKYLMAAGGVKLEDLNTRVYTAPEGDSLELEVNGKLYHSGFNEDFTPFSSAGSGFGMDFSITANINALSRVTVGILDVGGVKFKDAEVWSVDQSKIFEGFEMGLTYYDNRAALTVDPNELEITPDTLKGQTFSIGLPTRLLLHGEWGLGEKTDKREQVYAAHTLMLTYIQGLRQVPGGTTKPLLALAYKYNLANRLSMGSNISILSPSKFTMGAFLGLHTPSYSMSIGSSTLLRPIMGRWVNGSDFTFNTSFTF